MSNNVHINIANPESNQKKESNYESSDVEQAFKDFHPSSWQDLITKLKQKGDAQWHLTPGEVKGMVADAENASKSGAPFHPGNPDQVYHEMEQHRANG